MTTQLLAAAKAPWFSTQPIENQLEPKVIAAAAQGGVFKGKKVAVFSQSDAPPGLVSSVITALKKHGVTSRGDGPDGRRNERHRGHDPTDR